MTIVGSAFLAGSPSNSIAQEAETAKLITEDAFPVDAGRTEFELGYQFVSTDSRFDNDGIEIPRGDLERQLFVAKATHGIRQDIDASIELQWRKQLRDEDNQFDSGIGNVTTAIKWLLYRNELGVSVAWVPGITAPFAGDATEEQLAPGQNFWSINNLLVLSYVSGPFNVNIDAGYFLAVGDKRGNQRGEFIGDIAVGWQFRSWLQFTTELNVGRVSVNRGNSSKNTAISAGAIMNISDSVRIDVGYQEVIDGRNAEKPRFWIVNLSKTY